MISVENYFQKIEKIKSDWSKHSDKKQIESFVASHEFVVDLTNNGSDWNTYAMDEEIKETVDLYLEKLNKYLEKHPTEKSTKEVKEKKGKSKAEEIPLPQKKYEKQNIKEPKEKEKAIIAAQGKLVERFPEEFRFLRRFINLNGKSKTKEQLLSFINSLQRSIVERKITKDSPFKEQIKYVEKSLIKFYNDTRRIIPIGIKQTTIDEFKSVLGEEKIYPSIPFIKRFIGIHGKWGVKDKAKKILATLERALKKGKINAKDKYYSRVVEIEKLLKKFIKNKEQKTLTIEEAELNGLLGAIGCPCEENPEEQIKPEKKEEPEQELAGIGYGGAAPQIMNSMDFANMRFKKLGFTGKWRAFIGDPSPGFSMMVFAKPKMGKSYLCIEFAGYLAREHGKVLYVAREEGLDDTLQSKLHDTEVQHPNLDVSSFLPLNLSEYDFIFLDSVNKLGLTPKDLENLRKSNPGKSFIFVFQSTKDGNFRGNNEFQHDVDVVVDIPELGKALQYGRFNQGGELDIFD